MSRLVGADTLVGFSRRARQRLAVGHEVEVAVGDDRVTLAPAVAEAVLAAVDGAVEAPSEPCGEITTGQAADLLGMSRPAVVHLIERGDLRASRVGTRRRLDAAEVLAHRERARSHRRATLRQVIAASRDLDLYR